MSDDRHIDEQGKQLLQIFERTGCLTEEVLLGYAHGTLSTDARKKVEQHLLDCRLCSDALDGVMLLSGSEFRSHVVGLRSRVQAITGTPEGKVVRFRPWRVAAAASLMACLGISGWLLKQYLQSESNENAVAVFDKNYEAPIVLQAPPELLGPSTEELAKEVEGDIIADETLAMAGEGVSRPEWKDISTSDDASEVSADMDYPKTVNAVPLEDGVGYVQADSTLTITATGATLATGGTNAVSYSWTPTTVDNVEIVSTRHAGRQAKDDQMLKEKKASTSPADAEGNVYTPAQDPEVKQQLLDEGVDYYSNKQYVEANDNFSQVLAAEPTNETALFYSAVSYIEEGQPGRAITNLDQIIANKGSAYYDSALWYRAMALLKDGQAKPAKKQLIEIIESGSSYEERARKALEDF